MRRINQSIPLLFVLTISMAYTKGFAEERAIYLVLMDGNPVTFHNDPTKEFKLEGKISAEKYMESLVESHDRILQNSLEVGSYDKLYSFKHVINGFAVHTTPSQAKRLRKGDGVKLVEKDRGAKLMTTYTPQLLGLPQGVWPIEGGEANAGEGITIGIIDTGIDPTHPSFSYDPMNPYRADLNPRLSDACEVGPLFPLSSCNEKIVLARHFSIGAAAAFLLNVSKDLSPFDEVGHGTHVASIAAGNWGVPVVVNGFKYGSASGMAPRARIAVYKAIYPQGGTVADLVSAIDQAIADGVDMLVLSVGPDEPPEDAPTFMNVFDIALLFARRAGIFVAQAVGNKGPAQATVVSFSPWAMGVASSNTDRTYTPTLVLGDNTQLKGVGLSGPTNGNGHLKFKLVSAKDAMKTSRSRPITQELAEECQHPEALKTSVVKGSIVICNFSYGFFNGTSTVTAILETARALGFMGFVLVANPILGDFIAEPLPFSIPGVMIPRVNDVQVLLGYYEKHTHRDSSSGLVIEYNGRAAIREGRVASFSTKTPPLVSRFSSRGPDVINNHLKPTDVLKPDILAPGHQIWAAWSPTGTFDPILNGYNFALLSGTSMATPHIVGIAALIKQSNPSWNPSMIASAMSTTASKFDGQRGLPIMAQGSDLSSVYAATPFDYGAGLVNPIAALDPGLVFSSVFEDYIGFLCSTPDLDPMRVQAATGKTCNNNTLRSPSDLNLPSITISTVALMGSHLVHRSVKNVAGKQETYLSSVLPPRGVEVSVHPPWFTITPHGTQSLQIRLNVTERLSVFTFGEIVLTGSLNHIVRMTLSIFTGSA